MFVPTSHTQKADVDQSLTPSMAPKLRVEIRNNPQDLSLFARNGQANNLKNGGDLKCSTGDTQAGCPTLA